MVEAPIYEMTLDLNVLNHLGLNLYSNVPAVLAEVVANSWDADAELVTIDIDKQQKQIVITDDGHGMDVADANKKYLTVGYERRRDPSAGAGSLTPKLERPVMGRKGIGKLSLFSIADVIAVHSVKDGQKVGFQLDARAIKKHITEKRPGPYRPKPIPPADIKLTKGTRITLTRIKRQLRQTQSALKKRLARRFSIIGSEYRFAICLNSKPITIQDRDYFHKLQYLWEYAPKASSPSRYKSLCPKLEKYSLRSGSIPDTEHLVRGWIGTPKAVRDLKDEDDNLNKIVIMVRGKLAQEDILEEFGEGGIYSKYLIGEIHADFLDRDDKDDIATSSRQKIIEDDPRYQALKGFILTELKQIQNSWTEYRNEQGRQRAEEIPAIKEWFKQLSPDNKKRAEALFGKINQLTFDSEADRRQVLKNSVLAFESLRYKQNLDAIDRVSPQNLQALTDIFTDLDDIEATLYHQIVRERVQVIDALQEKVEHAALEKAVQEHVFKHLWLLDPSWERATETAYMEQSVHTAFQKIEAKLSSEEKAGRLDIKYTTTSGKHVIVELKRSDRITSTGELLEQTRKYRNALRKILKAAGQGTEPVEVVCVVGRNLRDWADENGRQASDAALKATDTRVVMYQELLQNAHKAYQRFLDSHKEAGRVSRLISEIEEWGQVAGP